MKQKYNCFQCKLPQRTRYFNGCEASNIIFLTGFNVGKRNNLLRGVKNIICVDVGGFAKYEGMKEDNRFD